MLLVCAWEKEDLPERRPKMKEMVGESNEGTFFNHPEGRVVEPPHVSDAHLRLDSPSLVLSNQILNDLQKRNCDTDNLMADRAAAFHPSANLLPCRRRYAKQ